MYELTHDEDNRRTYRSTQTGTEIFTRYIYTDGSGNKWWGFEDLLSIPFIRKKASEHITQLYGAGMNVNDVDTFIASQKAILKSNDPDKYEKAYAGLLNFEKLKEQASDPVKQCLGLCTVYILKDDELPDVWSSSSAAKKMELWALDAKAQGFFLQWLTDGMNNFTEHYTNLSKIVSTVDQSQEAITRE